MFGITLSIIVVFSVFSNHFVSADSSALSKDNIETSTTVDIETNAQRLSLQIDNSNNRHIIYLTGERPILEPFDIPYNGTHNLKYGIYVENVLTVEDVTNDLVFPYHYDLRVDSLGQVHVAYIANNYTLYYTIRDPTTGMWTTTQLSTPSEMWAMMPAITLGSNEQPRIVYSVLYKENADLFFDQEGFELIGLSSLFYAALNDSTWLYFDVGDNHSASFFEQRDFVRQRIYNPGLKIEEGFAYIAFTNKVAIAVETRMQYIKIPEIPEVTIFLPRIHQRAEIASSPASTYRRPSIQLVGDGVVLAFGAWQFGGATIAYHTNSSALEDPNPAIAADEWETHLLMGPSKLNRQVESVSSIEQDGTITVAYSFYDLFNAETVEFSQDVFMASFAPNGIEIGEIENKRVTDTYQIYHYSPNIAATGDDELIILYIAEDEHGLETKLVEINVAEVGNVTETETLKDNYQEWNKTYGGIGLENAYALIQVSDGGFVLAGSTFSYGSGGADMWLVKTDKNGDKEWDQTYGGIVTDVAFNLIQTSDGGFALAGYTYSTEEGADMRLVKTDNDGNMEWDQTYGGRGDQVAKGLVQMSDEGFALAGYTNFVQGGGSDIWLVKTDAEGNVLWDKTYDGSYGDLTNPLIQTSDGGFAMIYNEGMMKIDVSGTVAWTQIYNEIVPKGIIQTTDRGFAIVGENDWNLMLVKTDSSGAMEWDQKYIPKLNRRRPIALADSLIQTADKGFLLAGYTSSYGAGGFDMWLVKTDFSGVEQWNQTYGGVGSDITYALIQTSDGGFALAGSTNSFGAGGYDMWLVKLRSFDDTKSGGGNGFLDFGIMSGLVAMSILIFSYRIRKRKYIAK